MGQVTTTFPDSTYSSSNKPSVDTLKADIVALEVAHNATDNNSVKKDGTVAFTADQSMAGYKLTNVGTGSASTDAANIGVVQSLYPIGSVYLAVVATNPGTLLGFGTWTRIAEGQMLVGYKTGDADFGTVEGTGGAKTTSVAHTHTGPSHTHTGPSHTHTGPSHAHSIGTQATLSHVTAIGDGYFERGTWTTSTHNHGGGTGAEGTGNTGASGTGNTGSSGTGSTGAMSTNATPSIINPYFVIYAWKRTA